MNASEGSKINLALIRGDSLNEWEGGLWGKVNSSFEVTGFCSRRNLYALKALEYPIIRLPSTTDAKIVNVLYEYIFGIFQKMCGLEKKLKTFDIAHTAEISYFYTNQAVRAKKINPRLRVVTTVWDNSFNRFENNYWGKYTGVPKCWKKVIDRNIQENAEGVDVFLPVSKRSADLLKMYGVPENKIRVLTPAVRTMPLRDIEKFDKLLSGKKTFLMVNRLVKEKGVYDVLRGWKEYMMSAGNGVIKSQLVIIGSGPEFSGMKKMISDFNIGSSTVLLGNLPNHEVRSFFPRVKALILGSLTTPAWEEQFGYVLAEAICGGCPVVSTNSGAIPEVVEDAGIFFPEHDHMGLKECLLKLDEESYYQKLKDNCERVAHKFKEERFLADLNKIYSDLTA